ncbi:MarR family transcriptional regulator [Sporomusa sp.]|uniref:MarR family transcriptional regulator n=1 Tax=Sporomusa sp. TaxID=2078658 RepID=UPI002CEE62F3|nr:MarR family transcriptional regulator [Sporomusa sp.]HWR09097.1 MarR family transcriptional regulator [Sporomusa sp.]
MQSRDLEVQNLIHKIEALVYNFNNIEDYEEKVLQAILNEQDYEELRDVKLSLAECHVIDCIERNALINTTAIAKKLNITKGGISKITAKLIKKDMIEVQRLANNQKETYYTLTPLGRKIFGVHAILHEQAQDRFCRIFSAYKQAELSFADKFLDDLISTFQVTTTEQDRKF